ncbi:hypothetical protein H6P81_010716 [Aristolochia fimbriata]|uniref:Probable purine permease n=1 Tax=Aristolochia fimbriata TaxID=158543 RepID=A0AAV7ESY5_ARIFI|nr:hypothetical protein H6P81_010716 [Aristolochia fimbriata]
MDVKAARDDQAAKEIAREAADGESAALHEVLEPLSSSGLDHREKPTTVTNMLLLFINISLLAVGNAGGPLLTRLYYLQGGSRIWFTSLLLTGGWPIMLVPLFVSYFQRRRRRSISNNITSSSSSTSSTKFFLIGRRLFMAAAFVGVILGLDNFMYAYGLSKLPVSTASLIMSTQLMFNAVFAFLVVKQRFSPFSINSLFLLTLGAVVLGLHSTSDMPATESRSKYILGFFITLGCAALYGVMLPLLQLAYTKSENQNTYTHVIEVQTVMSITATAFSAIGMAVNNDFQGVAREISAFGLGDVKYVVVVVSGAVMWQFFFLGLTGVVSCSSSLLAGVVEAALLPTTQILAVIFFHEKFNAEKGISLALALWGLEFVELINVRTA